MDSAMPLDVVLRTPALCSPQSAVDSLLGPLTMETFFESDAWWMQGEWWAVEYLAR